MSLEPFFDNNGNFSRTGQYTIYDLELRVFNSLNQLLIFCHLYHSTSHQINLSSFYQFLMNYSNQFYVYSLLCCNH